MAPEKEGWLAANYSRLSREDGDRPESDSIINQQRLIDDFCSRRPDITVVSHYADDGFTGTNFDRPAFQRMLGDIEAGRINCVVVKDLSRFGRDYIDMGYYLERFFPQHGVRFIAVNDAVDSSSGPYDMLLPLKNVFNAQYAKDISEKVRGAFDAKRRHGEFVGAFASYGYLKDPLDNNRLVVDGPAAAVVQRIFRMAAQGTGQLTIAKLLNSEGVPCPSEYKRLMGERYNNGRRLAATRYWTYATVHRLLQNEMYLGNMVQGRAVRPTMHGRARAVDKSKWQIVSGTHKAIISRELWDAVQAQCAKNTRTPDFESNLGLFAGLIKCGDCGRALVKTNSGGRVSYSCGSYRRYGKTACSSHYIPQSDLEHIILGDLNRVISAAGDLVQLAKQAGSAKDGAERRRDAEEKRLAAALERIRRLKQSSYEDYKDALISRDEFLRYKADYDRQEEALSGQLAALRSEDEPEPERNIWLERLVELGRLDALDRQTVALTVREIRLFENKELEIDYLFSESLGPLLEDGEKGQSLPESEHLKNKPYGAKIG